MPSYHNRSDRVDPLDVLKSLRKNGKHAVQKLAKMTLERGGYRQVSPEAAAEHFAFEVLMQTSRSMPPVASLLLQRIEEGDLVGISHSLPLTIFHSLQTTSHSLSKTFHTGGDMLYCAIGHGH